MRKGKMVLSAIVTGVLAVGALLSPLGIIDVKASNYKISEFNDVRTGSTTTFFIDKEGTLWGCGYNGGYLLGPQYGEVLSPIPILKNVIKVNNENSANAFAITEDHELWGWGFNSFGLVDEYDYESKYIAPKKIMDNIEDVAVGTNFVLVLKTDQTVWGWGMSQWGQLGKAIYGQEQKKPIQVADNVKMIAAAGEHAAIIKTDKSLWCSGYNRYGQLGTGTDTNEREFVKINDNVKYVALEDRNTYFIDETNDVWGCGNNDFNRVNSSQDESVFIPDKIISDAVYIDAGGFGGIAIKSDNTLWGWGGNPHAELGGTQDLYKVPVKLMDNIERASYGSASTAVLKKDGTVWVVGSNQEGRIGLGKEAGALEFTQLSFDPFDSSVINFKLDKSKYTIAEGKKMQLYQPINNFPISYKMYKVTFKSSNKKVATVDQEGVIKGKSAGSTYITVTVGINGKSVNNKIKITVRL